MEKRVLTVLCALAGASALVADCVPACSRTPEQQAKVAAWEGGGRAEILRRGQNQRFDLSITIQRILNGGENYGRGSIRGGFLFRNGANQEIGKLAVRLQHNGKRNFFFF